MERKDEMKIIIGSILAILTFFELVSYGAGFFLKGQGIFFNPPALSNFQAYMTDRHPTLGWPTFEALAERTDSSGSRPCPAFPEVGSSCVALYGDSFTWSVPVDDEHAWGNVLARLINCRVANYGFGAFGTDQAELRFEETNDSAKIVILNHFTGDIRRNVNQFRNFLQPSEKFGLKPRYKLVDGELKLIPLPTLTPAEAKLLLTDPAKILHDEFFLPGGLSGVQVLKFPYTLSLVRAVNHEHFRAYIKGVGVWSPYYNLDHPSGALQLTTAIMHRFVEVAKAREKYPILTIIPNRSDMLEYRKAGTWPYKPLVDQLNIRGVETFEFGPGLLKAIGDQDICDFMQDPCNGHFNEKGYALLAELMANHLRHKQLIQ
jgi:hypothetical protein